ncbi:MAG TPA: sodium/glutamate symporter [Vicinamibacterales bacterium]|nr:sodium/glutamate symporter [Vicinamibacterales bacterium]
MLRTARGKTGPRRHDIDPTGSGSCFAQTMNIAGAMELTMASATAGLVLGSVLGGPLAEYLVRRHR